MKQFTIILLVAIAMFSACSNEPKYEQTEGGLLYRYCEKSTSELAPQQGNKVQINVKYFNENDSLIFCSRDFSSRFIMDFDKPISAGKTFNDALAMMHEGDSVSFKINAQQFYKYSGQTEMLAKVSTDELYRFEIRMEKILSPEIVEKEIAKRNESLKTEEEQLLTEYIATNYPDLNPTESGLYYVETRQGSGKTVGCKSLVAIHYTATYINGEPIYSTYQKNNPLIFSVDDPNVWACLAEAVQRMQKGTKATIIAPSQLAAGEQGDKALRIPARKTIVFDLELIDFKN